jgi:hypothetical protein
MATPTNLPTPAVAGQVLTAAYVNQLAGAFRVLQVVAANTTTGVDTATSTFVDTGLTATITPQSTSSKVLVFVSQNGLLKQNNTSVSCRLVRGATTLSNFAVEASLTSDNSNNVTQASAAYLDSPAANTATTYKTQYRSDANIGTVHAQYASAMSTIILMEISA